MKRFPPPACYLLWVALVTLGAALSLAEDQPAAEHERRHLGILRSSLPPGENPIIALEELFEEFPDWARQEFIDNNDPPPEFHKFVPSKRTLRVCRDLQARARKIIARGPGQITCPPEGSLPQLGSYVILDRLSSALAADAYNQGRFFEAAGHLFFIIEFSGFLARSEPDPRGGRFRAWRQSQGRQGPPRGL